METDNGHGPDRKNWPRFGDKPHQVMHPDTMQTVVQLLFARHRRIAGALFAEAVTGERYSTGRPKGAPAELPAGGESDDT